MARLSRRAFQRAAKGAIRRHLAINQVDEFSVLVIFRCRVCGAVGWRTHPEPDCNCRLRNGRRWLDVDRMFMEIELEPRKR